MQCYHGDWYQLCRDVLDHMQCYHGDWLHMKELLDFYASEIFLEIDWQYHVNIWQSQVDIKFLLIVSNNMSRIYRYMGVNEKVLQLHAIYKKLFLQVTRESVSVLQDTQKSVSGTASHARCIWTCNKIEGLYDKTIIILSTKLCRKKISLDCCHWHCYSCCALITIQTATNLWYS